MNDRTIHVTEADMDRLRQLDDPAAVMAAQVVMVRWDQGPLPDRSETDRFFEVEGVVRGTLHEVYRQF